MTNIRYLLNSGKNSKIRYYLYNYWQLLQPKSRYRARLERKLQQIERHPDKEEIARRVHYYCKPNHPIPLPPAAPTLREHGFHAYPKVYFFDSYQYIRYFDENLHWNICPGDVTFVPEMPSIVKSRPLVKGNDNGVLFKLDKVRHFTFLKDTKTFEEKKSKVVFRGDIIDKENRYRFMEKFFRTDWVDAGDVTGDERIPKEWRAEKITLYDHLDFRYIMSLEGIDVASNLKWVMSSNSIAVMPPPTMESWFMEGTLIAGVHYIEVLPDFSDLQEKVHYYDTHLDEAHRIIENAHQYVSKFQDPHLEHLVLLATMSKYLRLVNQIPHEPSETF